MVDECRDQRASQMDSNPRAGLEKPVLQKVTGVLGFRVHAGAMSGAHRVRFDEFDDFGETRDLEVAVVLRIGRAQRG